MPPLENLPENDFLKIQADIIRKALGYLFPDPELDVSAYFNKKSIRLLTDKEIVNFYDKNKSVLSAPIQLAFEEIYPNTVSDDQIPQPAIDLYMDAEQYKSRDGGDWEEKIYAFYKNIK